MDLDDFSELQSCVRNNDTKGLKKVVDSLKQQNRFYHSDYSAIIEVVVKSGHKDMIEGVLPIVDIAYDDCSFLSYALRHRLPRDIIELLQPPQNQQYRVLEKFFMYGQSYRAVHWSQTMCSDALNKDIVKIIKSNINNFTDPSLQHLVDLVNEDKTRQENQIIASELPFVSKIASQRKI